MHLKRSAKEVVRHFIIRSGLNGAYLALRSATGQNVAHLKQQGLPERFSTIYRNRVWSQGRAGASLSGAGSEIARTNEIRHRLPELLSNLRTQTLLDAGCGDFNWMSELNLPCNYIGADIVSDLVAQNIQTHGSRNRSFQLLDATRDPLPPADTVLCREMLFHLSFRDIWSFLRNLRASGISTLIATNDGCTSFNADIVSGDFRFLNLTKSPFRFPPPQISIPDDEVSPGRVLAVWQVSALPQHR